MRISRTLTARPRCGSRFWQRRLRGRVCSVKASCRECCIWIGLNCARCLTALRSKGARPMGLSCLSNQAAPIVGDTSTIINLNATGCASAILRAVPNRFIITDVVLDELGEDGQSKRNDAELAAKLIEQGLISVAEVASLAGDDFERLVAGTSAAT